MRDMNSWVEVDKANAGKMIKAIDGKRYNNRTVRMNEADGGFKRPTDEGRKRTYAPASRERRQVISWLGDQLNSDWMISWLGGQVGDQLNSGQMISWLGDQLVGLIGKLPFNPSTL